MMDYWGHIVGVITVLLLVAFIGIWVWAWLPRHKAVFSRMARVPLERDDAPPPTRENARGEQARNGHNDQRADGQKAEHEAEHEERQR